MASSLRSKLQPRDHSSSPTLLRLQHLQHLATWASSSLPPLAPFLGSRLASACESLACPPPSSPHLTCQSRCESILVVGQNCSVRIRKGVSKKRRSAGGKEKPINYVVYFCHFCSSENRKPGTPKAYVKTKINELAARNALSKLGQGVTSNGPDILEVCNVPNNKSILSSKGVPCESPISSGKKIKRKGWVSLKELTASTTASSPALSGSKVATLASNSSERSDRFQTRVFDSPTRTMALVLKNQFENVTSAPCAEGETSENNGAVKKELLQQSIRNVDISGLSCVEDTVLKSGESLHNTSMMKLDLEQKSIMNDGQASSVGDALLVSEEALENLNAMKLNLEQKASMHDASPNGKKCLEDIVLESEGAFESTNAMKSNLLDASPTGNTCLEDMVLECGASLENTNTMRSNLDQQAAMHNASPTDNRCLKDIVLECEGSLENNTTMQTHLERNSVMRPMGDRCMEDNVLGFETLENANVAMIVEKQLSNSFQKQTDRGKKHMKQKGYKNLAASFRSLRRQLLSIPRLKAEIHDLSYKMAELTNVVGELANRLNEFGSPVLNVNPDVTGKSTWKAEDARVDIFSKDEHLLCSVKHSEALQSVNDVEARFPSTKKMLLEDMGGVQVLNSLRFSHCDPEGKSEVCDRHVPRERVICKSTLNPESSFESVEKHVTKNSNGGTFNSRKCNSPSRKIPVFWRYGRRWFAICKTYRKLKCRVV